MKQSSLDDSVGELDLTAAAEDDDTPTNDLDEPPDLPQPPSPRPGTPQPTNTANKGQYFHISLLIGILLMCVLCLHTLLCL